MATDVKKDDTAQHDVFSLSDFYYLCIARWRWFVLSLVVVLGLAVFYLLKTQPTYQRTAQLLVKQDNQKDPSVSNKAANTFAELGMNVGAQNVNNEVLNIQSADLALEAIKRLSLDVDYTLPGVYRPTVLYGQSLPARVLFTKINDWQDASFKLKLNTNGTATLSSFKLGDTDCDGEFTGKYNKEIKTPAGSVVISPTSSFSGYVEQDNEPIQVTRTNLYVMTNRFSRSLSVSISDDKATVIDISYSDCVPQRAADIINTLIAVYQENWMKDKNAMTVATTNFITDRLGTIQLELGDVDQNISSYKSTHALPDVNLTASTYMEQSKENQAKLLELRTKLQVARYVRDDVVKNDLSGNQLLPSNSGIDNAGIESQIQEYNNTQLRRNNLVSNSSDQNPIVADYDASLQAMRKSILASLDKHIASLNIEVEHLQANEGRTMSQISSTPAQAKYLQTVGRQQKVKEELYLFLLQKREENELSQAFTPYNTRVISHPTGSLAPVQPRRGRILLAALVIGLLLPATVIFLRESNDTRLRGRKDLDGVSLPFVGEIPLEEERNKRNLLKLLRRNKHVDATPRLVVKADAKNSVNEAFRVLRANFEFVADQKGITPIVMLTSFNPGSGKTFVSVNLAASLAVKGKSVLVVDGDMRHGSASRYFGSHGKGLSNYLGGYVDSVDDLIITSNSLPTLHILPSGTVPPNPTELLYSERLPELLEHLRSQYDYIFIDCPPIEIVADTQIINQYVDRTIFVVRAGLLERSMLPVLERLYEEKRYKNMLLVLNGTHSFKSHYAYGYGYGYGYHSNYNYGY